MRWMLRSKIHRARVTEANVEYIGSVTIDADLLEKAGLLPGEKVLITSVTTGNRLETYVIAGEPGSGVVCMNGPTAHLVEVGELVIIMGFELSDELVEAKVVLVDDSNRFTQYAE